MKPFTITMGDPCGIGPEICIKVFLQGLPHRAFVIGDGGVLRRAARSLGSALTIREIASPDEVEARSGRLDVLALTQLPDDLAGGRDRCAGRARGL